jgi:hypothetical protein
MSPFKTFIKSLARLGTRGKFAAVMAHELVSAARMQVDRDGRV